MLNLNFLYIYLEREQIWVEVPYMSVYGVFGFSYKCQRVNNWKTTIDGPSCWIRFKFHAFSKGTAKEVLIILSEAFCLYSKILQCNIMYLHLLWNCSKIVQKRHLSESYKYISNTEKNKLNNLCSIIFLCILFRNV